MKLTITVETDPLRVDITSEFQPSMKKLGAILTPTRIGTLVDAFHRILTTISEAASRESPEGYQPSGWSEEGQHKEKGGE